MLLMDLFDALAINAIIMHCKFSAMIAAVWYTTEAKVLAGKCISDESEVQSTYPLLLFD